MCLRVHACRQEQVPPGEGRHSAVAVNNRAALLLFGREALLVPGARKRLAQGAVAGQGVTPVRGVMPCLLLGWGFILAIKYDCQDW